MKTELLGGFLDYQRRWLRDGSRFKIGLWARQTGKDFTCAAEAVLDCIETPRCHWLILACGERQARESLEKASEFARSLEKRANSRHFSLVESAELRVESGGKFPASVGSLKNGCGGLLDGAAARSESGPYLKNGPYLKRESATEIGFPSPPQIGSPINDDRFAIRGRSIVKRESATEIRFTNGSRITALPAKAGTIRGYSANLILTEFAFHDDPEGIWRAIFPSVSNPLRGGVKKVRIISTPNGLGNYFHELWMNSPIFSRHRITIGQAVEAGLPMEVEVLKAGLLDAEGWAQEYECEFADQSSVLLPYELIEGCEAAEAVEANSVEGLSRGMLPNGTPELFLGIDFGRKQDLTVCWAIERIRAQVESGVLRVESSNRGNLTGKESFMTREVMVMRRMGTPEQIEVLRPRVRLARRVCVDYTGAGVGLGDALRAEFGSKVELCTFTAGLKEEIFVKLRAAMERRGVWIPKSAEIREDLHSMHRLVSNTGQISFRASRSADGHSDRSTALALAVRAAESQPPLAAPSSVGRKNPVLARRPLYY